MSSQKTITIAMRITLLSTLLSVVVADTHLIENICTSANNASAQACIDCVTRKINLDITDISIVASSLKCCDDAANAFHADLINLIGFPTTDDKLKIPLGNCSKLMVGIIANGIVLRKDLSNGELKLAKTLIENNVMKNVQDCRNLLNSANATVPGQVTTELSRVESSYKISLDLLTYLSADMDSPGADGPNPFSPDPPSADGPDPFGPSATEDILDKY